METPEHAWHYTTAAGLLNIVSTGRLWASSAAFMNDRDEIAAGRAALQTAFEVRASELEQWQLSELKMMGIPGVGKPRQVFLLSASLDGDLLTLWRSYGNGTEAEYAIDLDPTIPLCPVRQSDADCHPEPAPSNWYEDAQDVDADGQPRMTHDPDSPHAEGGAWSKVEYLDDASEAAKRLLDEQIESLVRPGENEFRFSLSDYLLGPDPTAIFKQPGFSDEREVRAIWQVHPWWRFVLYRAGRLGITPYVEVAAPKTTVKLGRRMRGLTPDDIGRLPIRTIRIGPTRIEDDHEHSLRAFLDSHGYANVAIERSSTPYR